MAHHCQNGHSSDFVFKAKGREEYLVGDEPLLHFLYIQESLSNDENPTLIVVPKSDVPGTVGFIVQVLFQAAFSYLYDLNFRFSNELLSILRYKLLCQKVFVGIPELEIELFIKYCIF